MVGIRVIDFKCDRRYPHRGNVLQLMLVDVFLPRKQTKKNDKNNQQHTSHLATTAVRQQAEAGG